MNPIVKLCLLIGLSVTVGLVLSATGLTTEQVRVAAILVFVVSAWTTDVLPPAVVSLAAISLLVTMEVVDFETATSGFTTGVIWLLLGISILGYSLEKAGLVDKMARLVVISGGGRASRTILALIGAILILTILVPTALARAGLISVLTSGVIRTIGERHAKAVSLTATMAIFALQLTVMTGTGGALYLVAYLETHGPMTLNYLSWLIIMLPPGVIMGITVWIFIVWKYRLVGVKVQLPLKELDGSKRLNLKQWRIVIISFITLCIWIIGPWLNIDIYAYTLLLVVILLLPGVGGISWDEAKQAVPWGTLILFGGALAVGIAIRETGLASYMASFIMGYVRGEPTWLVVVSILLIFFVCRIIFVNLISLMVTVVPIVLLVGPEIGWNPVWIVLFGLITGSAGYLIPAQSPVSLVMLEHGHFTESELRRTGIIFTLLWSLVMVIAAFTYWPIIGLNPRL